MREDRFDVVRVVCMTYLVTYVHLYGYIYPHEQTTIYVQASIAMAHASLGLFTFVSGYLLGKKYCFGQQGNVDLWTFYKKRILRIFPLFVVSSILLWLIDFNNADATLNGLLCISPFVDPKPMTLYYIPVILWCYLITPLISRHGLRWRVIGSLLFFTILLVARFLFPSIDNRFVFNVFFYFVGVISASCFDWKFKIPYGVTIKTLVVVAVSLLVAVSIYYSLFKQTSYQMLVGAAGVFAILFLCEGIAKLLFDNRNHQQNSLILFACRLINIVSYASMTCYMFHRFFFWGAERIWNPSDTTVKWLYMIAIVYPVIVALSYVIQKLYDTLAKR